MGGVQKGTRGWWGGREGGRDVDGDGEEDRKRASSEQPAKRESLSVLALSAS